jgi:hypothetical protein
MVWWRAKGPQWREAALHLLLLLLLLELVLLLLCMLLRRGGRRGAREGRLVHLLWLLLRRRRHSHAARHALWLLHAARHLLLLLLGRWERVVRGRRRWVLMVEHKVEVVLDVVGAERGEVGEHEALRRRGVFVRVRLSVTLAARASAARLLWSAKGQRSLDNFSQTRRGR